MQSKRSGWTIVEVLVVTVIIGILVSFAIPSYLRSIERSQCSHAMATLRTIRQAELSYFTANQTYSLGDFVALGLIVGADLGNIDDNQWTYTFTATNPADFTVQANRLGGAHGGTVITLNELDVWGGTYPVDNP